GQGGGGGAHGAGDEHPEGGQHADRSRGDDADLAYVERAGDAGKKGGEGEEEGVEGGGGVAGEEPPRLAVADGYQHLPRRRVDDVATEQIRPAQAERGDHVEPSLRRGLVEGKAEHGLESGESVGAAQVHRVPVEGEPGAEGEGLGDDREIHAADPAPEGEEAEDESDHARYDNDGEQREGRAVERLPEERQLGDAVPDHEVR